jgi:hypothetical protein
LTLKPELARITSEMQSLRTDCDYITPIAIRDLRHSLDTGNRSELINSSLAIKDVCKRLGETDIEVLVDQQRTGLQCAFWALYSLILPGPLKFLTEISEDRYPVTTREMAEFAIGLLHDSNTSGGAVIGCVAGGSAEYNSIAQAANVLKNQLIALDGVSGAFKLCRRGGSQLVGHITSFFENGTGAPSQSLDQLVTRKLGKVSDSCFQVVRKSADELVEHCGAFVALLPGEFSLPEIGSHLLSQRKRVGDIPLSPLYVKPNAYDDAPSDTRILALVGDGLRSQEVQRVTNTAFIGERDALGASLKRGVTFLRPNGEEALAALSGFSVGGAGLQVMFAIDHRLGKGYVAVLTDGTKPRCVLDKSGRAILMDLITKNCKTNYVMICATCDGKNIFKSFERDNFYQIYPKAEVITASIPIIAGDKVFCRRLDWMQALTAVMRLNPREMLNQLPTLMAGTEISGSARLGTSITLGQVLPHDGTDVAVVLPDGYAIGPIPGLVWAMSRDGFVRLPTHEELAQRVGLLMGLAGGLNVSDAVAEDDGECEAAAVFKQVVAKLEAECGSVSDCRWRWKSTKGRDTDCAGYYEQTVEALAKQGMDTFHAANAFSYVAHEYGDERTAIAIDSVGGA